MSCDASPLEHTAQLSKAVLFLSVLKIGFYKYLVDDTSSYEVTIYYYSRVVDINLNML